MNTVKKNLILSDVHYRTEKADKIIAAEGADNIYFLGDFFDPKGGGDSIEKAKNTALWLKNKLDKPNHYFILGNHDQPYKYNLCKYIHTSCSGFSMAKSKVINEILSANDWNKIKRFHILDDILLTHAGLSNYHVRKTMNLDDLIVWLEIEIEKSEINLEKSKPHWIFTAGKCRGGDADCGGINWCDIDEFEIIPKINQIFGHSYDAVPRWMIKTDKGNFQSTRRGKGGDINLCLDTGLNHYAIWDGKQLEIKSYSEL